MDHLKEAYEYAGAAFDNSRFMLVVCISFLSLRSLYTALKIRHAGDAALIGYTIWLLFALFAFFAG